MNHLLRPIEYLENSGSLTKQFLESAFSELGIKFEFIKGHKGYSLPRFVGKIVEPRIPSRCGGGFDYDDYFEDVREFYDFHKKLIECNKYVTDEFDNKYEIEIIETGESNSWIDTIKKEITITYYTK